MKKVFRVDEAAEILAVSRDTVRRLVKDGGLEGIKIRHCLGISAESIEGLLIKGAKEFREKEGIIKTDFPAPFQ